MSDASWWNSADGGRKLHPAELALLIRLLGPERAAGLAGATVVDMSDGGMGSIRFAPFAGGRRFGSTLAGAQFTDVDGVAVSVALHADEQGRLLELDLWKADFSPLVRYPEPASLSFELRRLEGSGPVHLPHPA